MPGSNRAGHAHRKLNRIAIHAVPKQDVVAHLTRLGHAVEPVAPQERYDFLVNGNLQVTLRVAYPSSSQRRVRAAGRSYNYVYRAWCFNFHHRGEVSEQYSDFFLCIPMLPEQRPDLTRSFLIPWTAISGKTFYLPDSTHKYGGKFAKYRNAWELLANARAQVARA